MINTCQEFDIIQQYYPNLTSRLTSKFKSCKPFESALYRRGRDEKSVFWYWEINYELGHFRHFQTIDLAEGEKRFREEDFTSWPQLEGEDPVDTR